MRKKVFIGIVGLLVIGALAVSMTGIALAQEDDPTPAPKTFGWHGRGGHFTRGLGGEAGMEAIAEMLGMTADELSTQLWGGKSLADLAAEAGVDLADIQDAVNAAHEDAMRAAIEQAVEDGNLTEDHANWLLEGLDKGFLGGRGFGGFGHRGSFGGRGAFGGFGGKSGFNGFGRFPGDNNTNTGTSGA